jgi:hypothetical protein
MALAMARRLRRLGYQVALASNGPQAIQCALSFRPHVILTVSQELQPRYRFTPPGQAAHDERRAVGDGILQAYRSMGITTFRERQ